MPSSGSSARIASRKASCGASLARRWRSLACRSLHLLAAGGRGARLSAAAHRSVAAGSARHRRSARPPACGSAPALPDRHRRGRLRARRRCPNAVSGCAAACRRRARRRPRAHSSWPSGRFTLKRIAAVEHAAAAPIGQHRRLQHARRAASLRRGILRAAAGDDQHALGVAEQLRGGASRRRRRSAAARRGAARDRRDRPALAPDVDGAFERRRAGTALAIARIALATLRRRLSRARRCAPTMIDQPRDDAGLVADLVQMAEPAADRRSPEFARSAPAPAHSCRRR